MKLTSVKVEMFRNILNSTDVKIEEKVTCLVGKNESGKSAFLHALWRLKPARSDPNFSAPDNYPAWLEKRHRNEGKDLDKVKPIQVILEWQDNDVKTAEQKFGPGIVKIGDKLQFSKAYDNSLDWTHGCNEGQAVKAFLAAQVLPNPRDYDGIGDFEELSARFAENIAAGGEQADAQLKNAQAALKALLGDKTFDRALWDIIHPRLPAFFYFAEYSKLPYSAKVDRVLKHEDLNEGERTARSLLKLGGTESDYMLNPDYERRKRELENVANVLSDDVRKYWTQNHELRVQPDITQKTENKKDGQHSVLDELKIRIWDNRHYLSLPFTEHSAGFQWFFSFLAAFSEYEHRDPPVVILLDEPAVGLHARAQADFLRIHRRKADQTLSSDLYDPLSFHGAA